MKRLIIDAQVFHTQALHRGMGKYSLELLDAVIAANQTEKRWDIIELLVSSKMPLSADATTLLGEKAKHASVVKLPLRKDMIYSARTVMRQNRAVVDRYVRTLQQSDPQVEIDFLILSPLQGGISSVFPSDTGVHRAALYFDLIPLMFHEAFFRNPIARIENLTKLTEFLRADTFLAISKTVANDLAVHLGVDPQRIHNIDGGPIAHASKQKHYSVPGPFILMPTGGYVHKNNRNGVLGFNEFNKAHGNKYYLVVTSFFDPEEVRALSELTQNIIFTGNISGAEVDYLYGNCEALLFPTEYEGLGLPVLEAMEKDRPVACSDIAVFREMSRTAVTYFDPLRSTSIAEALERALGSTIDKREYAAVLKKYTWENCAQLLLAAFTRRLPVENADRRLRIAVFTQNPEANSYLARTVQAAHAAVSRWCDVRYFVEGVAPAEPMRPSLLDYTEGAIHTLPGQPLPLPPGYMPVYYLQNNAQSARTLFTALANPGVVVLNDTSLETAWQTMLTERLVDESRVAAERRLQEQYGSGDVNLLCSVLAHQKAIGVFSTPAKQVIEAVLKVMGRTVPVRVLTYPSSALVYGDIIPDKASDMRMLNTLVTSEGADAFATTPFEGLAKQVIALQGQEVSGDVPAITVRSDRVYEDVLSRAGFVYAPDGTQIGGLYDAMRYGSLPVYYGAESTSLSLPQPTIVAKTPRELVKSLNGLQLRSERYEQRSQEVVRELATEHSFSEYARQLYALLLAAEGNEA